MRTCFIAIIISVFCTTRLTSQNVNSMTSKNDILDTCLLSLQYKMVSVKDTAHLENKATNTMLLQIGKRISKFSDIKAIAMDSMIQEYSNQQMSFVAALGTLLPYGKGMNRMSVFKNFPKNKITVVDLIAVDNAFKYAEDKEKPNWKLIAGDTIICSYKCKKAATFFRGRSYSAWYTLELNLSEGPWKFWGLPGLILKINDSKNHYSFECIDIDKPNYSTQIYINNQCIIIPKASFNTALENFNKNPIAILQASGRVRINLPENIKSRPYNPIELAE